MGHAVNVLRQRVGAIPTVPNRSRLWSYRTLLLGVSSSGKTLGFKPNYVGSIPTILAV